MNKMFIDRVLCVSCNKSPLKSDVSIISTVRLKRGVNKAFTLDF